MCGRFVQQPVPAPQALWPALADELAQIPERYNLSPTQRATVVRLDDDAPTLHRLQWGLAQPVWATKHLALINARIDKVAVSPVYRGAFKSRHAVVPMHGFYEWREESGKKQPYFIHAPGKTLWAAALWEPRADDPDRAPDGSFTIITQQAEDKFKHVHDRMPVFLPPASVEDWLAADGDDALMTAVDAINRRYGRNAIGLGATGWRAKPAWGMRQESLSRRYTTAWSELPNARC